MKTKLFFLFLSLGLLHFNEVYALHSNSITLDQPIIYVTPPFHGVPATDGSVVFDIKNIGTGSMNWIAESNDPSWLTITSGSSGTDSGQISVSYLANSADYRVGKIIITAVGTFNSPDTIEIRQTAFGTDWIVKTSGTKENLTDVKFINDQLGWVCGNNGLILHTTDSGNTWEKQITPTTKNLNKIFFINSSIGWAIGDSGTVLKTTNGGISWELKNSGTTYDFRYLQFLTESLGWAGGNKFILKTTDGGNTWFLIKTAPSGLETFRSLHFRDAYNGILGGYRLNSGYPQLKTTDGGLTWVDDHYPTQHEVHWFNFAGDNQHGLLFHWVEDHGEYLYITTDGGLTSVGNYDLNGPVGNTSLSHINFYTNVWLRYPTYAEITTDQCKSWSSQFIGGNASSLSSMTSFDSTLAWAVGGNGSILRYQKTQTSKYLKLTSPNGGNTFHSRGTMKITWESIGLDEIQIDLYVQVNGFYTGPMTIADNVPANQGSYTWQNVQRMGTTPHKLKLTSKSFDQMIDCSDWGFSIIPSCFPWIFISSSGKSASIVVPSSINPSIGNDSLELGDVIGVFYHRNDSLICGGYTYCTDEDTTIITAWGDNDTTIIKDGFYEDEEMVFKIFKPNTCEEYFAHATFQTGASVYSTNGNYVLSSLSGINGMRAIVEGLYRNTSFEYLQKRDTIKAYLRNVSSPYEVVDSAKSLQDSLSFVANFNFTHAVNGTYYLVIKHRNGLEIWSTAPITFTDGYFTCYDFTDDSSKAYGNNLVQKGTRWCIYSGDVNQDGFIDGSDVAECFNSSNLALTGYVIADLNGDNIVDGSDVTLAYNNNKLGIGVQHPSEKFLFTKPANSAEPEIK